MQLITAVNNYGSARKPRHHTLESMELRVNKCHFGQGDNK